MEEEDGFLLKATYRLTFVNIITQPKDNRDSTLNCNKGARVPYSNQIMNDNSVITLALLDDLNIIQ